MFLMPRDINAQMIAERIVNLTVPVGGSTELFPADEDRVVAWAVCHDTVGLLLSCTSEASTATGYVIRAGAPPFLLSHALHGPLVAQRWIAVNLTAGILDVQIASWRLERNPLEPQRNRYGRQRQIRRDAPQ